LAQVNSVIADLLKDLIRIRTELVGNAPGRSKDPATVCFKFSLIKDSNESEKLSTIFFPFAAISATVRHVIAIPEYRVPAMQCIHLLYEKNQKNEFMK
jgi:hypothetical protein